MAERGPQGAKPKKAAERAPKKAAAKGAPKPKKAAQRTPKKAAVKQGASKPKKAATPAPKKVAAKKGVPKNVITRRAKQILDWRSEPAVVLAVLLVVGALVFALTGIRAADQASATLKRTTSTLRARWTATTDGRAEVALLDALMVRVESDLPVVLVSAEKVTALDEQELEQFQAAIEAGVGESAAAYNRAVGVRNALSGPHDVALDGLRAPTDALIAALDRA